MRRSVLLALALLLLAVPALAVDSKPLPEASVLSPELSKGCQIGNANATHFVSSLDSGGSKISILVNPTDQCGCPVGVSMTDMMVKINSTISCDVQLVVRLRSPLPGPGPCLEPGKIECETGPVTRKLEVGVNTETVKLSCPCADSNFPYFLEVEAVSNDCTAAAGFTFTQEGAACDAYLEDIAVGGDYYFSIWAETTCCNKPVGTLEETFGGVKSRFDD